MTDHEFIVMLSSRLNSTFWDYRCNFMHHPGSIPFDNVFFKLVKNSELVFFDEGYLNHGGGCGLFSFKNKELNRFLKCKTIEEHAYKNLMLEFFFLRKELMNVKRGNKSYEELSFYVDRWFEIGESYGKLKWLEAFKRHVEYNQSDDTRKRDVLKVFEKPIGDLVDKTLSVARKFRPSKNTPREDALGRTLKEIVTLFVSKNKKYPSYLEVIHRLGRLAELGHKTIQEVDKETEEVYWRRSQGNEAEPTSFKQIRERLTVIRKKNPL